MQLKALVCPCMLNDAFRVNSSAAQGITSSLDSLSVLSRVLLVSPLKSKPAWALSLQGRMRHTMKLAATSASFIFTPFFRPRSSLTYPISALFDFSN